MVFQAAYTIWIVQDRYHHNIILATYDFDTLIEYLHSYGYLHGDLQFKGENFNTRTLEEAFGERWLEVIKSFSAKKINEILYWCYLIKQVNLIEKNKDM